MSPEIVEPWVAWVSGVSKEKEKTKKEGLLLRLD